MTTPMKLSDAIRLGGTLPGYEWKDPAHCVCGKAMEAIGIHEGARGASLHYLPRHWPWTETAIFVCPVIACSRGEIENYPGNLGFVISHLALWHRKEWTTAQIADWVATIEPQEESAAAESPPVALDEPVAIG